MRVAYTYELAECGGWFPPGFGVEVFAICARVVATGLLIKLCLVVLGH